MEVGSIIVSDNFNRINNTNPDNQHISITYNTTHINSFITGGVCIVTNVIHHEPITITGEYLKLRDSFNYRGNGLITDEFEMAESGYGDYYEFAICELKNGEYILNPEKVLEVWYAFDYDRYYGRLNISKTLERVQQERL